VAPADKVLVVTDVSVTSFKGSSISILIQLSIANLANPPVYDSVYFGNGGTSDGMTSGFIVAPGQEILALQTFSESVQPGSGTFQTTIILRGYLAPNQ